MRSLRSDQSTKIASEADRDDSPRRRSKSPEERAKARDSSDSRSRDSSSASSSNSSRSVSLERARTSTPRHDNRHRDVTSAISDLSTPKSKDCAVNGTK